MGLSKELTDYFVVSQMLMGNKRKGLARIAELEADEARYVEALSALTFGACAGMSTVAEVAASSAAMESIGKNGTAVRLASLSPTLVVPLFDAVSSDATAFAAAVGSAGSASAIAASASCMSRISESEDLTLAALSSDAAVAAFKGSAAFASAAAAAFEASFSSASWKDIDRVATLAQENASAFSGYVGKTKSVAISGYNSHTFSVVGVAADSGSGFTFCCDDILEKRAMNSSSTTSGGWESSAMRSWLSGTLLKALPSDLQGAIKAVSKKNTANYGAATTSDKLWLLSATEVGLVSGAAEGSKYPAFADNAARVRKFDGAASHWWLRSVYSSSYFRYVNSGGSLGDDLASSDNGVVPCFSI